MIYFNISVIPCEVLNIIVIFTFIFIPLHVMTVLNLVEIVGSFLYILISLATLQLGNMVRTYQTARKRRGNLPGQVFCDPIHDEAGVSVVVF